MQETVWWHNLNYWTYVSMTWNPPPLTKSRDVPSMCVGAYVFSNVWPFAIPQTVACQALLSMGFSRQECWSGLPAPTLWALPNPGIKPGSLGSPTLASDFFTARVTWEVVHSTVTSKSNQSATELLTVPLKCLWILLSVLFSIPLSSDSLHFSPTYFKSQASRFLSLSQLHPPQTPHSSFCITKYDWVFDISKRDPLSITVIFFLKAGTFIWTMEREDSLFLLDINPREYSLRHTW